MNAATYEVNQRAQTKVLRCEGSALIEEYQGLVRRVARKIYGRLPEYTRGFDEEDLVSVGMLGLLEAHERYDHRCGTSFEHFAAFRIRGTILDEIRKNDFFSRRLRQKANRIKKVRTELQEELKREPENREVAKALNISLVKYQKISDSVAPYRIVDSEDMTLHLVQNELNAEELLEKRAIKMALLQALEELPERQQLVLDLSFNRELSGREIAEILEISEGRVSQIKSEALKALRNKLSSELVQR